MDNNVISQGKILGNYGEEIEIKVLEIVTVENNDYALVVPVDNDDDDIDDEEKEIVIMKLKQEGDEQILELIEDDAEFEMVANALSDGCECEDENCSCHHER